MHVHICQRKKLPFLPDNISFDRAVNKNLNNNNLYLLSLLIKTQTEGMGGDRKFIYLIVSSVPGSPGSYEQRGCPAFRFVPERNPLVTAGESAATWVPIRDTLPGQEDYILSEGEFDTEKEFRIRLL